MVVQWKQEGPILYHAEWMNMQLDLAWEHGINKWRCWVNGTRTRQRYDSVEAAKAGVDAVVLKLLSNGLVVPVEQAEQPRLAMQGLINITASIAVVRMSEAVQNYTPQGARSGRIRSSVPSITEVECA